MRRSLALLVIAAAAPLIHCFAPFPRLRSELPLGGVGPSGPTSASGGDVCADADGDGVSGACGDGDCNDADPSVWKLASAFVDHDGDGATLGPAMSLCVGAKLPTGYLAAAAGDDCDDADPTVQARVDAYADDDQDGHRAALASSLCIGATLPAGFVMNAGDDCNDTDPTVWSSCGSCADSDGDGYYAGCDAYTAQKPGPDCSPGAATAFRQGMVYVDMDGDLHSLAAPVSLCMGTSAPSGYLLAVSSPIDCDDGDASEWQSCGLCVDTDGDGYYAGCDAYPAPKPGPDCNDAQAHINPAMTDTPDQDLDCKAGMFNVDDTTAIFVSTSGDDALGFGTKLQPYASLHQGLAKALSNSKVLAISQGTYSETTVTASVSVFGGYAVDFSSRSVGTPTIVKLSNPTGLVVSGAHLSLQALDVRGADSAAVASCYGINMSGSYVLLVDSNATAGTCTSGGANRSYALYTSTPDHLYIRDVFTFGGGSSESHAAWINGPGVTHANKNSHGATWTGTPNGTFALEVAANGIYVTTGDSLQGGNGLNGSAGANVDGILRCYGCSIVGRTTGTPSIYSRGVVASALSPELTIASSFVKSGAGNYNSTGVDSTAAELVLASNIIVSFGSGSSEPFGVYVRGAATGASLLANSIAVQPASNNAVAGAVRVDSCNGSAVLVDNILDGSTFQANGLIVTSAVSLHTNDIVGATCVVGHAGGSCEAGAPQLNSCASWLVTPALCASSSGNLSTAPGYDGAFHLPAGAGPMRDTGQDPRPFLPTGVTIPWLDFDGQARPNGAWDIGGDEAYP